MPAVKEFYTPTGLIDFNKLDAAGLNETDRLELGQLEGELTQYLKQIQPQEVENISVGREPFAGLDDSYIRETQRRIDEILERYKTPSHEHGMGQPGTVEDDTREEGVFTPQASVVLGYLEPPPEVREEQNLPKEVALRLWQKAVERLQGKENYGGAIKIYRVYKKRYETGEWTDENLGIEPVVETVEEVMTPKAMFARALEVLSKYELQGKGVREVDGEWVVDVEGDLSLFRRPDYADLEKELADIGLTVAVKTGSLVGTSRAYKPHGAFSTGVGEQLELRFDDEEKEDGGRPASVGPEGDKEIQVQTALEQMFPNMGKKEVKRYFDGIKDRLDWSLDIESLLSQMFKVLHEDKSRGGSLVKEAPGSTFNKVNNPNMSMSKAKTPWGGVEEGNAAGQGFKPSKRNKPVGYLADDSPAGKGPVTAGRVELTAEINQFISDLKEQGYLDEDILNAIEKEYGVAARCYIAEPIIRGSVKTASIEDDSDFDDLFGNDGTMPDLKARMKEARVRNTTSYKEVIAASAELLDKLVKKIKGVYLNQSSIQKVEVEELDKTGFARKGVAEWRADLEEPQARVKKAAFFTFAIENGEVVAPDEFRDSIGRTYPMTMDGVEEFFDISPDKDPEELEWV